MLEIFKDRAGEWRYRVKGRNGEILVTSEGYTRRDDALRGLHTLRGLFRRLDPSEMTETLVKDVAE